MTLDKLIKSVEGLNGIEITDDTLVIRNVDEIRDYSFKLSDIEDYEVLSGSTINIWLKVKRTRLTLFYKNGTNNHNIPWRKSIPSVRKITHYSWE